MKGILIVWFFCLCYACLAQPFQTSFTVQQNNFPATVVEVNGDYFVAGTTKACQICLASIYLTKLSSNGTVINTWLYSFAQDVRCQRMKPTEDAGFIFVGDTHGLAIYPFVLKVDSLKNIQWTYFDSTYNGVFNDVYVEGNSYVIIGTSFNPSITTPTTWNAGDIAIDITGDGITSTTITRQ